MYHSDTDILFPMRVAPNLRDLRGDAWRDLVDQVCRSADASLEQLAFTLLLVRLSGCLTCHSDSYRALRGCTLCAIHTIRRFRGEDSDLLVLFQYARDEVDAFFEHGQVLADFFSDIPVGGRDE